MSAQPLLQRPSSWNTYLRFGMFSIVKMPPEGRVLEKNLKISLIVITVFDQMLEISVTVQCRDTYLKLVGAAQKIFEDKSKYHFESTFQRFPKDQKGLCTGEAVKAAMFSRVYQTAVLYPLVYRAPAKDISKQLDLIIKSLQAADGKIEEIAQPIQAFVKSRTFS